MSTHSQTVFHWLQARLLKEKKLSASVKEEIQWCTTLPALLDIVSPWKELYRDLLLKIEPLTPELAHFIMNFIRQDIERAEKMASEW